MRTLFAIIFTALISFGGYCQDTTSINERKIQFNAKIGITYEGVVGNRYIKRSKDSPEKDQYDGFTKKSTLGFQAGIVADFKIHKKLHISAGLIFAQRKSIYEGDRDSVLRYGTPTSIHKIVKYEYLYNNIELPILFSFKFKKINLHTGINLILVSFYEANYSYIPSPFNVNDKTKKTIKSTELSNRIYPTFQISYNLKVKKVVLNPFLGIDIGKNRSLYFQSGINIPLEHN